MKSEQKEEEQYFRTNYFLFFLLLLVGLPLYFVGYNEDLQPFLFNYHKENGTVVGYNIADDDGLSKGSILKFTYDQYGKLKLCSGPLYNKYKNNKTPHHFPLNSYHDVYVRNGYDGTAFLP